MPLMFQVESVSHIYPPSADILTQVLQKDSRTHHLECDQA